MKHNKYEEIYKLVDNNIATLLTGPAGSSKSTTAEQVIEALGLKFYEMTMTKQTTVSAILGFVSINGNYIPTLFREAYENGGGFLKNEIDAADVNVLLCFNSIENGYISFPDKLVRAHKDFRLIATANPQSQHNIYTGRSKLDASTLDRFETVEVDRDEALELFLTSKQTYKEVTKARSILSNSGASNEITMRDAIRLERKRHLGLKDGPYESLFKEEDHYAKKEFLDWIQAEKENSISIQDAKDIDQLWSIMKRRLDEQEKEKIASDFAERMEVPF